MTTATTEQEFLEAEAALRDAVLFAKEYDEKVRIANVRLQDAETLVRVARDHLNKMSDLAAKRRTDQQLAEERLLRLRTN